MKKQLISFAVFLTAISCDTSQEQTTEIDLIQGFWSRETVYLNGENSNKYVDFLNDGTNFLHIKQDKTFARAYDMGLWDLSHQTLTLDRNESTRMIDWTYIITELSNDKLILETKLTEGQYCCGFDAFTDNEIITITEVYKRQ